jgi:ABC-type bacteriocin/lantibiotic exporter with double-glycine peptidase domain
MTTLFRLGGYVLSAMVLFSAALVLAADEQPKVRHTVPDVPYIKQLHPNTCGTAALAMLLQYRDKKTTEEDLLEVYPKTKKTGFCTRSLSEHCHKAGYKTDSGAGTIEGVKKLLEGDAPVIVYQHSTPNRKRPHLRVVVGYDDQRKVFIIWDPSPQLGKGHEIHYETFEKIWRIPYYNDKTHFYFAITGVKPPSEPEDTKDTDGRATNR